MIQRETNSKNQENTINDAKSFKASSSSTTSSWSRLKDPRIVRVSRAFGGKDRHSKVCTVRGLRDRRVRLSVPTAIQLYDLQDQLGLNQPSKVVDWLLNAAKHEIDELPPLQIPQGSFSSLLPMMNSNEIRGSESDKLKIGRSNVGKCKDVSAQTSHRDESVEKRSENNQDSYVSADNFPYNSSVRWDPSTLSLSHPPRGYGLPTNQPEDWHNFSLVSLQQTVSVESGSHQVLVYQPGMSTHSYFPSQIDGSNAEFDPKQLNFQSSMTQPVRPIHFNMTANLLPSQDNHGN